MANYSASNSSLAGVPDLGLQHAPPSLSPSQSNAIQQAQAEPLVLHHKLYVLIEGRQSKAERTNITDIECDGNPIAVRGYLQTVLQSLGINKPVRKFIFGYRNGGNRTPSTAIINWNMARHEDICDETVFTLVERPGPIFDENKEDGVPRQCAANKASYSAANRAMDFGEDSIRERLSPREYMTLDAHHSKALLRAKYHIVSNCNS